MALYTVLILSFHLVHLMLLYLLQSIDNGKPNESMLLNCISKTSFHSAIIVVYHLRWVVTYYLKHLMIWCVLK